MLIDLRFRNRIRTYWHQQKGWTNPNYIGSSPETRELPLVAYCPGIISQGCCVGRRQTLGRTSKLGVSSAVSYGDEVLIPYVLYERLHGRQGCFRLVHSSEADTRNAKHEVDRWKNHRCLGEADDVLLQALGVRLSSGTADVEVRREFNEHNIPCASACCLGWEEDLLTTRAVSEPQFHIVYVVAEQAAGTRAKTRSIVRSLMLVSKVGNRPRWNCEDGPWSTHICDVWISHLMS